MKILIPQHRAVSWNTLYAQKHWSMRQRLARQIHTLVRAHLDAHTITFAHPVHITIEATYRIRPVDASNVCAKLYEDGLKGYVIVDDGPEFVHAVTTISRKGAEDSVVITVEEIEWSQSQ